MDGLHLKSLRVARAQHELTTTKIIQKIDAHAIYQVATCQLEDLDFA